VKADWPFSFDLESAIADHELPRVLYMITLVRERYGIDDPARIARTALLVGITSTLQMITNGRLQVGRSDDAYMYSLGEVSAWLQEGFEAIEEQSLSAFNESLADFLKEENS
jgi:hypothetical protein